MSSARITRLLDRVKRLGIGEPHKYIKLFSSCGKSTCTFWTNEKFAEFHKTHPGPALLLGCPKVPEDRWIKFGAGNDDDDHQPADCEGCEYNQQHED